VCVATGRSGRVCYSAEVRGHESQRERRSRVLTLRMLRAPCSEERSWLMLWILASASVTVFSLPAVAVAVAVGRSKLRFLSCFLIEVFAGWTLIDIALIWSSHSSRMLVYLSSRKEFALDPPGASFLNALGG
jgi:hypothetical protein